MFGCWVTHSQKSQKVSSQQKNSVTTLFSTNINVLVLHCLEHFKLTLCLSMLVLWSNKLSAWTHDWHPGNILRVLCAAKTWLRWWHNIQNTTYMYICTLSRLQWINLSMTKSAVFFFWRMFECLFVLSYLTRHAILSKHRFECTTRYQLYP